MNAEMTRESVSRYMMPRQWVRYDVGAVLDALLDAKTAAAVLNRMPYLPQWIAEIHQEQLRLEAVGTSRIEGAEFTPREQEEALAPAAADRADLTHSQRQLRSANATYRWMMDQPADRPVTADFILNIHRRIVTGCDDNNCEPGALRPSGWNVVFGAPTCRGAEGGEGCRDAFEALTNAIASEFQGHDRVIQALAAHYHIGAMHPFGDGNGRTARALEAFMLRRAGVNDIVMVSLSNYYHAHKDEYLTALAETRRRGHDLTPFLTFGLTAIADRCNALAGEIAVNHKRLLFREFAGALFGQLRSERRRILGQRQLQVLNILLDGDITDLGGLIRAALQHYTDLKFPRKAIARDLGELLALNAITLDVSDDSDAIAVNLDWPQQFAASDLLELYERAPSAASSNHPAMAELSRLLRRRR